MWANRWPSPSRNGHGHKLVHATHSPEGTDLAERYRAILSWPEPLVLNRCFVSELVYVPLLHGRSCLTHDQVMDLAAIIANRDYCSDPLMPWIRFAVVVFVTWTSLIPINANSMVGLLMVTVTRILWVLATPTDPVLPLLVR